MSLWLFGHIFWVYFGLYLLQKKFNTTVWICPNFMLMNSDLSFYGFLGKFLVFVLIFLVGSLQKSVIKM